MAYVEGEIPTVVQGNGYGNSGFFGGDGIWAILLFALIFNGGWGGNWGGMGAGNNMLYDINANTNRGFDILSLSNGLEGIQNAVTSGFANAEVSRCNAQTNLLQAINSVSMGLQQCLTKHKKPIKCFATSKFAVGTCA